MAFCNLVTPAAMLFLTAAVAAGQAPIVQPGAPGENPRVITAATAGTNPRVPADADIAFMQGMIHHHSQAVEMTALMPTHTHNKKLLALGERISISQTDEMQYMKQWLADRGKPVADGNGHMMHHMAGMDMKGMDMKGMDMAPMPMMPGMLTAQQMEALKKAKGAEFDRLFLTGMIQHHTGALTMVDDLFNTPGAGQDNVLFDFATDVDNTQTAEINIMRGMLKEKQ
jgi:uncharacterized protein (DUF305 family)